MKTMTATLAAALLVGAAAAPLAVADNSLPGDILVDMRMRYENVAQDGKLGADAITLRTRLAGSRRNGTVSPSLVKSRTSRPSMAMTTIIPASTGWASMPGSRMASSPS